MIRRTRTTLKLLLRLALPSATLLAGPVLAQTTVNLEGTCQRLVIAGQDATASCSPTLANSVERRRASFGFTAGDGQSLTFSGTGAQQERTEETDPLQPINLVVYGQKGSDGVVQNTVPAVGACTFSTPSPGKTAITCEANSAGKGRFEGVFVTDTKPASGAPSP